MTNEMIFIPKTEIARETEKAFAMFVEAWRGEILVDVYTIWIPKSLMVDGKAPLWIIEKNAHQMCEKYHLSAVSGRGMFLNGLLLN